MLQLLDIKDLTRINFVHGHFVLLGAPSRERVHVVHLVTESDLEGYIQNIVIRERSVNIDPRLRAI